jgi:hypothetical protein
VHKRFLAYREAHEYFGRNVPRLDAARFAELDAEFRALDARGEAARTGEEQARFGELARLLLRD